MSEIIVTTAPYGQKDPAPRTFLQNRGQMVGWSVSYNETDRKYAPDELTAVLRKEKPSVIVAGTETYDEHTLDLCPNLEMIARVGIGLDSVDLDECRRRGVVVTHTPDAPTNAVAELTITQILTLLRRTHVADSDLRDGRWRRFIGRELQSCRVGVIGAGRIGSLVIRRLSAFHPRAILYHDLDARQAQFLEHTWASKEAILRECDVVTIHIPMNENNLNYLDVSELAMLRDDAVIINTSRGGVINENALYRWLQARPRASAAVDVFEEEPYTGKLLDLPNVLLSPHLGSCSRKSRLGMEWGAAVSVGEHLQGQKVSNRVV